MKENIKITNVREQEITKTTINLGMTGGSPFYRKNRKNRANGSKSTESYSRTVILLENNQELIHREEDITQEILSLIENRSIFVNFEYDLFFGFKFNKKYFIDLNNKKYYFETLKN